MAVVVIAKVRGYETNPFRVATTRTVREATFAVALPEMVPVDASKDRPAGRASESDERANVDPVGAPEIVAMLAEDAPTATVAALTKASGSVFTIDVPLTVPQKNDRIFKVNVTGVEVPYWLVAVIE